MLEIRVRFLKLSFKIPVNECVQNYEQLRILLRPHLCIMRRTSFHETKNTSEFFIMKLGRPIRSDFKIMFYAFIV